MPLSQSKDYEVAARSRGDDAKLSIVEGAGHFDLIAPQSSAWPAIEDAVRSLLRLNKSKMKKADKYNKSLGLHLVFALPIITEVVALDAFYEAEAYHQDYARRHPDEPYIAINDLPKVANLRKQIPELYTSGTARR